MDKLSYDIVDDTATITLNNPDLRNALSVEMAAALQEAIDDIEDSDVRCVVIQGSGGTFCAGGDIESMLEGISSDADPERKVEEGALPVIRAVQSVYNCPLPTVAKVDGQAFGAGGALVLACDLVLASDRAKISFGFRQVGLSIDSGTSYLLTRAVGENVAKELVYTGELIDADRAEELGLFNRVYPADKFEQQARELIHEISGGPTIALKESKQLLQGGLDRSLEEAIEAECGALERTLETEDHVEGVTAFMERRSPEFDGT